MSATAFYDSRAWRRVRREVLRMDHNECQYCKQRGHHTKADTVHHAYHLDEYPQYGLIAFVDGKRNLISACRECHETVCHPERLRRTVEKEPVTQEMW